MRMVQKIVPYAYGSYDHMVRMYGIRVYIYHIVPAVQNTLMVQNSYIATGSYTLRSLRQTL